jgi:hypothetical protein
MEIFLLKDILPILKLFFGGIQKEQKMKSKAAIF